MQNLSDDILEDIEDVFLDLEEFARVYMIEIGEEEREIKGILTSDSMVRHTYEGILQSDLKLYLKADSLPYIPDAGQKILINGKYYQVSSSKEGNGLLILGLLAYTST